MSLCPNCGAELLEGGRFCMKCGQPIAQPMPQTQAPVQPQPMPLQQSAPQAQPMQQPMPQQIPQQAPSMPEQSQDGKHHNMTEEFIERRKREKGIY